MINNINLYNKDLFGIKMNKIKAKLFNLVYLLIFEGYVILFYFASSGKYFVKVGLINT